MILCIIKPEGGSFVLAMSSSCNPNRELLLPLLCGEVIASLSSTVWPKSLPFNGRLSFSSLVLRGAVLQFVIAINIKAYQHISGEIPHHFISDIHLLYIVVYIFHSPSKDTSLLITENVSSKCVGGRV